LSIVISSSLSDNLGSIRKMANFVMQKKAAQ
jgi:hypothetical protein